MVGYENEGKFFFLLTDRRERKFDRNNADGYSTYNSKQTYKNSLKKYESFKMCMEAILTENNCLCLCVFKGEGGSVGTKIKNGYAWLRSL